MTQNQSAGVDAGRLKNLFTVLLRQHRGDVLLYSCILFGIYTMPTLISFFNSSDFSYWANGAGKNFNGFSFAMFVLYIIAIPLSLGCKHFGYMHSKQAVDVFHAIPVKRSELYIAESAAGSLVMAVPVIINFGIIFMAQVMAGYGQYTLTAMVNMFLWLAAGYVLFSVTGFCAVNTGSGLDTALFSMAMNGAPAMIFMLNQAVRDALLYGYVFDDRALLWATRLSPISTMVLREVESPSSEPFYTTATMLVWIMLSAAISALSAVLYRRRKSELAEVYGNLGPAQVVVRAMVYYLGSVLFALAFMGIFGYGDSNSSYFIIGAGVGALVTGIVGELVLTRSPSATIKRAPAIVGVAAVAIAGAFMYSSGGFGFEMYLPNPNEVKSATISFNDGYNYISGRQEANRVSFDDPEVVEMIITAHRTQLEAYEQYGSHSNYRNYYYNGYFTVTYNLSNGRKVSREYGDTYDETAKALARLSASPGYVQKRSEFFFIEPGEVTQVALSSILQDNSAQISLSSAQKEELLAAIQDDMLSRDADALMSGAKAAGFVELSVTLRDSDTRAGAFAEVTEVIPRSGGSNQIVSPSYLPDRMTLHFTVYESDESTLGFLRRHGLTEHITPDFSDVTQAWLAESYDMRYYRDGMFLTINLNSMYKVHSMVDSLLEKGREADYKEYGSEVLIELPTERLDELLALGEATAWTKDSTIVLAFRTQRSTSGTGFVFISAEALPQDLAQELKAAWDSGYGYRYTPPGEYTADSEVLEPMPPEQAQPDISIVPVEAAHQS